MSDKKISELTALTAPDGAEELVVNDSGTSKKITIDNLITGIDDNATSTAITIDASENITLDGWVATNGEYYKLNDAGATIGGIYRSGAIFGTSATDMSVFTEAGKVIHFSVNGVAAPVATVTSNGLTFNGDTAAANALDDYEEGTFTATLRGDSTEPGTLITANTAKYTKIGNTVHLTISFEAKNTTGYSGDMSISGMPFTNGTGRGIFNAATYYGATFSGYATGVLNDNGNSISIMDILSNLAWGAVQHRPASDTYVWISGTYNV